MAITLLSQRGEAWGRCAGEACSRHEFRSQMPQSHEHLTVRSSLARTAHAMEGDDLKRRSAGCDGCLATPIGRATFLSAIAESIQSSRPNVQNSG